MGDITTLNEGHNVQSITEDFTENDHGQPPSYESLFGKIKEARETSENKLSFAKKIWTLISKSVGFIMLSVCLGISLCVSITTIVIGCIYLFDCRIKRVIPGHLIVGGTCTLVHNLFSLKYEIKARRQAIAVSRVGTGTTSTKKSSLKNALNVTFGLMMFVWLIAGSAWIYSVYSRVNTYNFSSPEFCNYILYYYAFCFTTLLNVVVGVGCFIGCCTCCAILTWDR